jgi:phosphoribosylformylglycinamidine (FGAM) synthase PurS component
VKELEKCFNAEVLLRVKLGTMVNELEKERDDYKEISEKDHLKCIELGLKAENLEKRKQDLKEMFDTVVILNQRYEAEFIKARHLANAGYWCPNCHANMKGMPSKHDCIHCGRRVSISEQVCDGFMNEMDWWEKAPTPKEGEECQK